MKVYIGFSTKQNSALSATIRFLEETEYSHVYMRVESKYGEYVYQASGLQVNFMNIDVFKKMNKIVEEYEFDIPDEHRSELLKFFIKYAGYCYSMKALFQLAAILICGKVGIKPKFKGDDNQTFICSELGALFCEVILGIDIPEDEDFVTPSKLNPYVKAHGKRIV
jgi:hypothetical protein